jgi:hypothetical protein
MPTKPVAPVISTACGFTGAMMAGSIEATRIGVLTTPRTGGYLPVQVAGRFSRNAQIPSCASAAMEFIAITDFVRS